MREGNGGRTYVEWADKQGIQGRGYKWQKSHQHRLTIKDARTRRFTICNVGLLVQHYPKVPVSNILQDFFSLFLHFTDARLTTKELTLHRCNKSKIIKSTRKRSEKKNTP